jgi:hypothetical protein
MLLFSFKLGQDAVLNMTCPCVSWQYMTPDHSVSLLNDVVGSILPLITCSYIVELTS